MQHYVILAQGAERKMKHITSMIFIAIFFGGCEAQHDDANDPRSGDTIDESNAAGEPAGSMWGPCLFEGAYGGPELDGWGCDGGIEGGMACAKPVNNGGFLSICVPRSDGGCAVAPFGLGFDDDATYCVPLCDTYADCEVGQECSGFGMCAWPEGQ